MAYNRKYSDFKGVDFSSDPASVSQNRFAYCVNMWKDYSSEDGGCVETFPGFRIARSHSKKINGLYNYVTRQNETFLIVHSGTKLYVYIADKIEDEYSHALATISGVADSSSTGFIYNDNFYILDGTSYYIVKSVSSRTASISRVDTDAYIPVTFLNGRRYEQRNLISDYVYQRETQGGDNVMSVGCDDIYEYVDLGNNNVQVNGFKSGIKIRSSFISLYSFGNLIIPENAFAESEGVEYLKIECKGSLEINPMAFFSCTKLKYIEIICNTQGSSILMNAFARCNPDRVYIKDYQGLDPSNIYIGLDAFDENITPHLVREYGSIFPPADFDSNEYCIKVPIYEAANNIDDIDIIGLFEEYTSYLVEMATSSPASNIIALYFREEDVTDTFGNFKEFDIKLRPKATNFTTVQGFSNFADDNAEYIKKKQGAKDAINACRVCAVYDGRIFLTGNPDLPNTVFYSNRNLTGINDPSYFGAYNYFNDGNGNLPNVDMLSTPSMLMVLKRENSQGPTIYYHTGQFNPDANIADYIPRIYPSEQGSSGVGSVGDLSCAGLCCNFRDDSVFLSKYGLENISKQTLNLERTIGHVSSMVDRLLTKEELNKASMVEWCGYLCIACNGRIYMADSRAVSTHKDGSYQYEWFYLEGVGTYEDYSPQCKFVSKWPIVELGPIKCSLKNCIFLDGSRVDSQIELYPSEDIVFYEDVIHDNVFDLNKAEATSIYYVERNDKKYLVEIRDELAGRGSFYGATKLVTIGDKLLFGTDNGCICIVNTDKRGIQMTNGENLRPNEIDPRFYSFAGVSYVSGCSTRLDDCNSITQRKNTVPGTVVGRFKTMPGSVCKVNISNDGRTWERMGQAFLSRFDFADFQFSNFSFGGDENGLTVFPELTRGWIQKQYYFYSDEFCRPFGLYELSYAYYFSGKTRY